MTRIVNKAGRVFESIKIDSISTFIEVISTDISNSYVNSVGDVVKDIAIDGVVGTINVLSSSDVGAVVIKSGKTVQRINIFGVDGVEEVIAILSSSNERGIKINKSGNCFIETTINNVTGSIQVITTDKTNAIIDSSGKVYLQFNKEGVIGKIPLFLVENTPIVPKQDINIIVLAEALGPSVSLIRVRLQAIGDNPNDYIPVTSDVSVSVEFIYVNNLDLPFRIIINAIILKGNIMGENSIPLPNDFAYLRSAIIIDKSPLSDSSTNYNYSIELL